MKNIHVKVSVAKVVSTLEAKVTQAKKAHAENEKLRKVYTAALEKWEAAVAKAIIKAGTVKSAHENSRYWGRPEDVRSFDVRVVVPHGTDLPAKPAEPECEEVTIHQRDIEEIENVIRILKMSDDEYVSASVFKKFSQFL